MAKYKAPPVFDCAADEYVDMKYDMSVWKSFTDYPDKNKVQQYFSHSVEKLVMPVGR